jgi:hypothetical protein
MSRGDERILTRVLTLVIAGLLTAVAARYVHRWLDTAEQTYFGYEPNPEGVQEFLAELDQPYFSDAGAEAIREAKGVDTFLYRSLYRAYQDRYKKQWVVAKQGIGDCVSFGWCHAVQIAQSVDWESGRLQDSPLTPATESCYGGSRVEARNRPEGGGGWSDGSYGGAAARWCRDWGIVYRQKYGSLDLTTYSAERAKQWGNWGNGGQGDNGKLDKEAKRHPAKHVALVRTFEEAAAAIESGYPVAVCSMQGFTTGRDSQGFCAPSGSWAHCMCFCAVRYGDRPGLLCLNSWGPNYVRGPKWPADQPEGSFWVDKTIAAAMLRGGDSFAVGSIHGFGFRDLHHGEWLQPADDIPSISAK